MMSYGEQERQDNIVAYKEAMDFLEKIFGDKIERSFEHEEIEIAGRR